MTLALGALAFVAAAPVLAVFGVQLVLHRAAWRAASAPRRCAAEDRAPAAARYGQALRETWHTLGLLWRWPFDDRAARAHTATPPDGAAGRERAVVLVAGYAAPRASLGRLARWLRRDGRPVTVVHLGRWWRDLDDAAERLGAALAAVRDDRGGGDVTLLAHGLAGLAARLLVARAGRSGIRLLVTVGTPHRGTQACPWWRFGPFRRDVRPGSAALRLLASAALPARLEAVAIASPDDALVLPLEHAHWGDACNVSVSGCGHRALVASARVYPIIAENLAPPSVAAAAGRVG